MICAAFPPAAPPRLRAVPHRARPRRVRRARALRALLLLLAGCSTPLAPESEVASALHRYSQGQAPSFAVGDAEVRIERVRFTRVLVKPEGEGYTAVATVDAEAQVVGGPAVSYLGVERIPFVFEGRRPRPREALLPALGQLVEVLRRKHHALAAGAPEDLEPLLARRWDDPSLGREGLLLAVRQRGPVPQPTPARWIVRVEREGAEVLEVGPEQPSDGPGLQAAPGAAQPRARATRTRFRLVKEAGGFRFASGLR